MAMIESMLGRKEMAVRESSLKEGTATDASTLCLVWRDRRGARAYAGICGKLRQKSDVAHTPS